MSDIEYRNRSISQLVGELNSLGEDNIKMQATTLIGVHSVDLNSIKRFKNSKREHYFENQTNSKKYIYNDIDSTFT
jgi:hypothetical protein